MEARSTEEIEVLSNRAYQLQMEAVSGMDFERAEIIARNIQEAYDREALMETMHFEEQSHLLIAANQEEYTSEVRQLTAECRQLIEETKAFWQQICNNLARIQMREATALEKQWKIAHSKAEAAATGRVSVSIATAKVLARCHDYKGAVAIKEEVQRRNEDYVKEALSEIDMVYIKRYKEMNERHRREYEMMHEKLQRIIALIQSQALTRKERAEAMKTIGNSEIPSMMINAASKLSINEKARKMVIQHFSPRKQPHTPQ